jgi:hypothetical protein
MGGGVLQMRQMKALALSVWLTWLCNTPTAQGRIHFISSSNVFRRCEDICGSRGLDCDNKQVKQLDCQFAAIDMCGKTLSRDNNNFFQCSYGGCFFNCDYGVYADKSSSESTCTSGTDCYNRQGSPQFSRVCACDSDESVALTVWQIIGIATGVFFFFSLFCALLMYFYMDYSLKQ